ncbi:hypothetical protein C7S13_3062 [Burkholderia cepacia]|nr:hypothetical protein [Burkholderia cepacia]
MERPVCWAAWAVFLADAQVMNWLCVGFEFGFFGMLYVGLPYIAMGHEL